MNSACSGPIFDSKGFIRLLGAGGSYLRFLSAFYLGSVLLSPTFAAGGNPAGYTPFSNKEFSPAGLGPHEPDLKAEFPGSAATHGISRGSATVSVFINADNRATDFLVVNYTNAAFGTALLETVKTCQFHAAKLKGTAVAGRCDFTYRFETSRAILYASDASNLKGDKISEPALIYNAVSESKLDKALVFSNAVLPLMPEDFKPRDAKPVKVFVTFFIDEEGRVRIPNVESAVSPLLIPDALRAVLQWSFAPPQVKGKPVLVFTGRLVRFVPRSK